MVIGAGAVLYRKVRSIVIPPDDVICEVVDHCLDTFDLKYLVCKKRDRNRNEDCYRHKKKRKMKQYDG